MCAVNVHRRLYERRYRRGRPRWDTGITPPEVVAVIEGDPPLPPGRALDLGCGTGTNVLYLVAHGWEAVGVDFSPAAIAQAREKAAGVVGAAFVEGDVTRLAELSVDGPFDFVLDVGCFHSVAAARRGAYAGEVARVARPGALFMVFAWGPFVRLPGSPRTRRREIESRFGRTFELVRVELGREPQGAAWFTLRRRWPRG